MQLPMIPEDTKDAFRNV